MMRAKFVVAVAAILPLTGPAFAEAVCTNLAEQCACAAPIASFAPGSALLSTQGSVQVNAANPGADPSGARLSVGDSAVVLAGGAAALAFPNGCGVALRPQSSLVIRDIGGCACASVVEAETTAYVPEGGSGAPEPTDGTTGPGIGTTDNDTGTGVDPAMVVGGVVAAAAIGTATYFVVTNSDDGDDDDEPGPGSP